MSQAIGDDLYLSQLTWLVTHDIDFLIDCGEFVSASDVATPEAAWLIDNALQYFVKYNDVLQKGAIVTLLSDMPDRKGFDKDAVLEVYDECVAVESPAMRAFLIDYTRKWAQKRKLEKVTDDLSIMLADGHVQEASELISASAVDVFAMGDDDDFGFSLLDDTSSFFSGLEVRFGLGDVGGNAIPTGLKTIDRALQGGLRGSELGVIIAAPNMGKSQFLCAVARHGFLSGYNVGYYSLEMNWLLVQERIWAGLIDVPQGRFVERWDEVQGKIKDFVHAQFEAHKGSPPTIYVKQYPTKLASVATIRGHLHKLKKKGFVPDLVVVDYGDILTSTRHFNARHEEIGNVFEDLRGLAVEMDIPVWTASQVNREGVDKAQVKAKWISDSWDKVKIADFIIGLGSDDSQRASLEATMSFLKVRNNEIPSPFVVATAFDRAIFLDMGTGREFPQAELYAQARNPQPEESASGEAAADTPAEPAAEASDRTDTEQEETPPSAPAPRSKLATLKKKVVLD